MQTPDEPREKQRVCARDGYMRTHFVCSLAPEFRFGFVRHHEENTVESATKGRAGRRGRAAVLSSRASSRVGTLLPFERACLGRAKSAQRYSYTGSTFFFFNENFGSEVRGQRWIRLSLF